MAWCRLALTGMLLTVVTPALCVAQTDNIVAVGAAFGARTSAHPAVAGTLRPVFIWRIGHGAPGWGFRYGFSWYEADIERSLAGRPQPFGRVNIRPILVGYGYEFALGSGTRLSANLKGGYAFSSFAMRPAFGYGSQSASGVQDLRADVRNTFVLKPELSAWIDLGRKVGVNISAGYMIARPDLALSSSGGGEHGRIRADMLMMQIGAAYALF